MNRSSRRAKARNKQTQAQAPVQPPQPVQQPTGAAPAGPEVIKMEDLVEGFNRVAGTLMRQFELVCLNLTYTQLQLARYNGDVPADIINPLPPALIDCIGDINRRLPASLDENPVSTEPAPEPVVQVATPIDTVDTAQSTKKIEHAVETIESLRQTTLQAQRAANTVRSSAPTNRLQAIEQGGDPDGLNAPQFVPPVERKGMVSRSKQKTEEKLMAPVLLTIEDLAKAYLHGSEVIRGRGNVRIGLAVGDDDQVEDAGTVDTLEEATNLLPGYDNSFPMYDEITADDGKASAFFATINVAELGSKGRVFVCAHKDYVWQLNLAVASGTQGSPETLITPVTFLNTGERYEVVGSDEESVKTFEQAMRILAGI